MMKFGKFVEVWRQDNHQVTVFTTDGKSFEGVVTHVAEDYFVLKTRILYFQEIVVPFWNVARLVRETRER